MLKFFFWALLCMNAVLFAYGQGLLGSFKTAEREPERIRNQLGTDKLQLLTAAAAASAQGPEAAPEAASAATPDSAALAAAEPAPPATPAGLVACTEVGSFAEAEARRFGKLLEPLALGQRLVRDDVTVQEPTQHMVLIQALASKDAADKRAAELKAQGVSNYFIMNDAAAGRWTISLGVFKSEASAQTLLATLRKQGVEGAKIVVRTSPVTRVVFRLRDLDAAARKQVEASAQKFSGATTRNCK